MNKLSRILSAFIFLFFAGIANADPLTGSLHFFDTSGDDICSYASACGDPLTGDYDASAGTLSFDPISIFSIDIISRSVELLPVGTHTRSDGFGGTITATVSPGQVGAYITLALVGPPPWPTFMIWDVTGPSTSLVFTPVDSDGDGIPGHASTVGPFLDSSIIFEFVVEKPSPIALEVTGGTTHECTSTNGTGVEVIATVNLTGGAVLDSISWTVDSMPAGSGASITPTLGLGSHNISATALTTTGETYTGTVAVYIVDTTDPVLDVAFIDSRSGAPVTHIDRPNVEWIEVRATATDTCDANPQTDALGGFTVQDGDLLKIQGNNDTVTLTTSVIDLSATATDATGNTSSGTATLNITD